MMQGFGQYGGLGRFGMPAAMLMPTRPMPFVPSPGLGPLSYSTDSLYGWGGPQESPSFVGWVRENQPWSTVGIVIGGLAFLSLFTSHG